MILRSCIKTRTLTQNAVSSYYDSPEIMRASHSKSTSAAAANDGDAQTEKQSTSLYSDRMALAVSLITALKARFGADKPELLTSLLAILHSVPLLPLPLIFSPARFLVSMPLHYLCFGVL